MPSKNGKNNFFFSRLFLFIIFCSVIFLSVAYGRAYYQDYQIRQEIQSLQDEARRLEAKEIESINILKFVKSTDFVEAKARTEFNLKKPGEQVAVVKNISEQGSGQSEIKMLELKTIPNPLKWWKFFTDPDWPNEEINY